VSELELLDVDLSRGFPEEAFTWIGLADEELLLESELELLDDDCFTVGDSNTAVVSKRAVDCSAEFNGTLLNWLEPPFPELWLLESELEELESELLELLVDVERAGGGLSIAGALDGRGGVDN
jgi:hypothetical protein